MCMPRRRHGTGGLGLALAVAVAVAVALTLALALALALTLTLALALTRLLRAVKWVGARCAAELAFLGEVRQAEALSAMQAAYPYPYPGP